MLYPLWADDSLKPFNIHQCLSLVAPATIYLVSDNLKFEAYFEVVYPFWVDDSLRTLKVYHCPGLPLVTPSNHSFSG